MTEDEGTSEKSSENRRSLWKNFDLWIDETPSQSFEKFEIVKSALIVHCEHTTIVLRQTSSNMFSEVGTRNSTQIYTDFMNIANSTHFVNGDDKPPMISVFELLSELFSSIPEFRSEFGMIHQFLQDNLSLLLDSDLGWNNLHFSVELFRSVYWQLCFSLKITEASESEAENPPSKISISPDEYRPQLFFSSFITAIIVSIFHEHEEFLSPRFPGNETTEEVPDFLTFIIATPHFRSLSHFFLVGLWLLRKYREEGGFVTVNLHRPFPDPHENEQVEEFHRRIGTPSFGLVLTMDDNTPDRIQRDWEAFAVSLLKKGLLKAPDGYRIVQKGGRPRKYPTTQREKKRKSEEIPEEVRRRFSHPEPAAPRQKKEKKTPKSSPRKPIRKNWRTAKNRQITAITSSAVVTVRSTPKKVVPRPEDVGLSAPIYVMQADMVKWFKEELKARRLGEKPPEDMEQGRVRSYVFKAYDEMHKVARLTAKAPSKVLSAEQKLVMEHFKETWRSGRSNNDGNLVEPEGAEKQLVQEKLVVTKSARNSGKATKKWKRRY